MIKSIFNNYRVDNIFNKKNILKKFIIKVILPRINWYYYGIINKVE